MSEVEGETFIEGLVYPPPAIRELVDKTAAHIGKRGSDGSALEDKIRQRGQARFNFINGNDPYHAYYQHKLQQVRSGIDIAQAAEKKALKEEVDDGRPKVPRPPPFEFLIETPKVDPVDLDIIKLTALFTARNGRRFQTDLASREKTNYQFDFLQPSHSLFNYFNRLVEQYTKVLIPDADRLAKLDLQAGYGGSQGRGILNDPEGESDKKFLGRRHVLKEIADRVEWEKWEGEQIKKREDEAEAARVAFAEIDWQDFVVVTTVEFTEADDAVDLPMPMSLAEVQGMSLRERKRQALGVEGQRLKNDEDEEAILRQAEMAAKQADDDLEADGMEIDMEAEAEQARQKQDEIKAVEAVAPNDAKIKPSGYVPRSKRKTKIRTTACQICGQQIPVDEITEHVRIELLDPRWKEKQAITEANRSASNLLGTGADVSASLRRLAAQRTDIFSEANATEIERRKAFEEEERRKAKAREAAVWDGHVASSQLTTDRFATASNYSNQIEAIHRAKGLIPNDPGSVPSIGPSGFIAPANAQTSLSAPAQPTNMTGSSLSAGPQANLSNPYTYNPQGQAMPEYNGITVPGAAAPAPNFSAISRAAESQPDGQPAAKRTKTDSAAPTYVDEQTWLASHPNPITLIIQMPHVSDNPKWNCMGQRLPLENVPLTSTVGNLRDRIQTKAPVPTGRQQIKFNDRLLTNSHTLASLNFDDGDVLTLAIKEKK